MPTDIKITLAFSPPVAYLITFSNNVNPIQITVANASGMPAGGTIGQVLTKRSSVNYDADWEASGGGGGSGTFTYTSQNKDSQNLVKGIAVTEDVSGSGFIRADCTSTSKYCVGLLNQNINQNVSGLVMTGGVLNLADWTPIIGSASLSAKAKYYLSTAGQLTNTPSLVTGRILQQIGVALDQQNMEINPLNTILL